MLLKVAIFALSLLMISAHPVYSTNREASQTTLDLTKNEVHEKTDISKNADGIWKSHVKNTDLYTRDSPNPMGSDTQHKLTRESERLHARLRQELTELRERLSPYPARPESSESILAHMGERLAPLAKQLQSAMSDHGQELCGHLRLYLQGLEAAVVHGASEATPYPEAAKRIGRTLDESGARTTSLIQDFKTKTANAMEEFAGTDEGIPWQDVNVRLEQEVQALSLEVQGRVGALKAQLSSLLLVPQPVQAEVSTSVERFCQSSALQDQMFHARIKEHLLGQGSQAQSQSESPTLEPLGLLEEDFSAKLSAVLQDILQTVQ